jgi:YVTN family beta-propeller protein
VDRREFLGRAAAVPLVLAFAPDSILERPRARVPVALVTADLEAHVVAVDVATGRVRKRIRTLAGPRSIERVGRHAALVAHTEGGVISILDARSLDVRSVVRGFGEPRYTAAAPDGLHAYVTDSGRRDVAIVDVAQGRVVRRVPVGGPARHVSLDPSGTRLWVSLGSKAERVAVLDVSRPDRPRVAGRIRPPFLAHDVGFAPGGRTAWVTSGDAGAIAVYDVTTRRVRRRLLAGAPPQHVTFLGGAAYVTSGEDGTLRIHAIDGARRLGGAAVPVGSYNVQQGGGVVVTPSLDRGTLCIVGPGGAIRHRVAAARSSHDACVVLV